MVNKYEDDYNILTELCNNIRLVKQSKHIVQPQFVLINFYFIF